MPASPCAWAEALYFRPLHTIRFSQEEGVRQRVSMALVEVQNKGRVHIPPDFVVDGAPQRVKTAHALMSR